MVSTGGERTWGEGEGEMGNGYQIYGNRRKLNFGW